MANVNIKFNGKEFLLSCDDGQEDHLEELSNHLNEKFEGLKNDLGNIGENKLLLITSIKIMDEYFETKKKINEKKNELENLKSKLISEFTKCRPKTRYQKIKYDDEKFLQKISDSLNIKCFILRPTEIIGDSSLNARKFIKSYRKSSIIKRYFYYFDNK